MSSWGKTISRIVSICKPLTLQNLDVLKRDSNALLDLGRDFIPLQKDGHISIFSVYELQKTRLSVWRSKLVRKLISCNEK